MNSCACACAGAAGKAFDETPQEKRPRIDTGREEEEPPSSWAGLQPDALGVVLRFLPCLADRARVRSVCRHWRVGARGLGEPPPLPLLVLPRFRFASLTPGGVLTASRHAWMPREVDADRAHCVGSSGAWLVGAGQAGGECFLLNAFSHQVLHLPHLGAPDGKSHSNCSLCKVELSAAPEPGSNYTVAAFAFSRSKPALALWKPGMRSWHVCQDALIAGNIDIAFHHGKLYMLWRFSPCLFALELGDDEHGVSISRITDCMIEALLPNPLQPWHVVSCNMVEWHGRLLLILRYYGGHHARPRVVKVEVFAMELSVSPRGLTKIHSLGGDCIFVGAGGCKSFPANQHGGVEGDIIYFVPDHYNPQDAFAYSMRYGRTRAIAKPVAEQSIRYTNLDCFPVWLFPSE